MEQSYTVASAATRNVMDIGSLAEACVALVEACDAAGTDPSEEDQASLLRSYQGILAWRSELESAVRSVDGAIDLVTAKVRATV